MAKLISDMNIGGNLRELRKSNGYTQEGIVAKIQLYGFTITRGTYSRYETGELNIPVSVLVALHVIYNCSYDDFFKGLRL